MGSAELGQSREVVLSSQVRKIQHRILGNSCIGDRQRVEVQWFGCIQIDGFVMDENENC